MHAFDCRKTALATIFMAVGILALCVNTPASARDERGEYVSPKAHPVKEAAPVLGRILEKNLEKISVKVSSLQWAHLPGRGLLYVGRVNLAKLTPPQKATEPKSEDDVTWENTRRELLGKPKVRPEEGERSQAAFETIQETLRRFADRVSLPEGEEVRVALYSGHGNATNYYSYYTTNKQHASKKALEYLYRQQPDSTFANNPEQWNNRTVLYPDAFNNDFALRWTGSRAPTEIVIVSPDGISLNKPKEQGEDAAVLARVIGKSLASKFKSEYWGVDARGRPGAMGFSVGDWGPVVVLNMTFPLHDESEPEEAKEPDLWEETLKELRGKAPLSTFYLHAPKKRGKHPKGINAALFIDSVKNVLANFAPRVRGLDANQDVTGLVFENTRTQWYGQSFNRAALRNYTQAVENLNTPKMDDPSKKQETLNFFTNVIGSSKSASSPTYILRLSGAAILRGEGGDEKSRMAILESIRVD